jgi:hypothetical protein
MKRYTQIEPNLIQTSETHTDGSFTSGIIRRGSDSWDELDAELVTWLDIPAYEADKVAEASLATFRATRQRLINNAVVIANSFSFDADEISIGRMASAILAAISEQDDFAMQWSLAYTATGVMTSITLSDLKQAHKLAVLNMASIWGVKASE